jgi:hypothetical protein
LAFRPARISRCISSLTFFVMAASEVHLVALYLLLSPIFLPRSGTPSEHLLRMRARHEGGWPWRGSLGSSRWRWWERVDACLVCVLHREEQKCNFVNHLWWDISVPSLKKFDTFSRIHDEHD